VFWLFWLSCQYSPSDWLERLLRGSLLVARGLTPQSPDRRACMILLVYCIVSLFVFVVSPARHSIFHSPMARYSLFVLKVPLNTNKPITQLERLLHAYQCELAWLDMAINFSKSCCIRVGPRCDTITATINSLTGHTRSWAKEMRYLGVYFVQDYEMLTGCSEEGFIAPPMAFLENRSYSIWRSRSWAYSDEVHSHPALWLRGFTTVSISVKVARLCYK